MEARELFSGAGSIERPIELPIKQYRIQQWQVIKQKGGRSGVQRTPRFDAENNRPDEDTPLFSIEPKTLPGNFVSGWEQSDDR